MKLFRHNNHFFKHGLLLSMLLCFIGITACNDNTIDPPVYVPESAAISGSKAGFTGTEGAYTVTTTFVSTATYSWTVPTGTSIISGEGSKTITVLYGTTSGNIGVVVSGVTGANDGVLGELAVTITSLSPQISLGSVNPGHGRVKEGDTLMFTASVNLPLDVDTSSVPSVSFASDSKIKTGTLSSVVYNASKKTLSFSYVAGAGDGKLSVAFDSAGIQATAPYGGKTATSLTDLTLTDIATVDNSGPEGKLSYSDSHVQDNMNVAITLTFEESTLLKDTVSISISGSGVDAKDTVMSANTDGSEWSYTYVPTGGGNGAVTVTVGGAVDLAGNPMATNVMVEGLPLTIDNTKPVLSNDTITLSSNNTAFSYAIQSNEDGMGWFVIEDTAGAVSNVTDIRMIQNPIYSNSFLLVEDGLHSSGGSLPSSVVQGSTAVTYNVYYQAIDRADNLSGVIRKSLVIPAKN